LPYSRSKDNADPEAEVEKPKST